MMESSRGKSKRSALQDTRWTSVKFKKDVPPRTESGESDVTDDSGEDSEDLEEDLEDAANLLDDLDAGFLESDDDS